MFFLFLWYNNYAGENVCKQKPQYDVDKYDTISNRLDYIITKGTKEMFIYGLDDISNYQEDNDQWSTIKELPTSITVDKDITSIGNYAFYDLSKVTKVAIPSEFLTTCSEKWVFRD